MRRMLLPDKTLDFEHSVHPENDRCAEMGCTPVDCGCGWGDLCDDPNNPQGCQALQERQRGIGGPGYCIGGDPGYCISTGDRAKF